MNRQKGGESGVMPGAQMKTNYVSFLQKHMDVDAVKRSVIANNISNYNTPHFKASKVSADHLFQSEYPIALKATNGRHLTHDMQEGAGSPSIQTDLTAKERHDGNNVDLTAEMIDMIKSNGHYAKAVQALNKEFFLQRTAIGN